jgi:hypothetical protein
MSRISRSIKTITVLAFVMAHVFALGFWAGSDWRAKHIDGTVVRNRSDALIYLLCTPLDTPRECAGKLATELQKERDAEKDLRIAEPEPGN